MAEFDTIDWSSILSFLKNNLQKIYNLYHIDETLDKD